ncbi:sulfite exporter TauE/SafE family protein [Kitasatospora sp. NBC_01287]|uniref:sulfite exporter TauE/SafE family protein n=1 Tax=Kitasatospora sp. NBC_01287 TaxID=2903573 RepID=UPI0022571FF7|nr:sulfite exporter TauE/SafE family protein [Kitasatospora sp. NBC_01287]MCX4750809.1 sulfite exporter TauE/SafE family protein [Kitasatospora sp. NBC_01287]
MTQGWGADLLLGAVVLAGASVQRMAGIGFALVAAPALALLLGAGPGVVLSNCAAGAISAIGLATSWRQVRPAAMVPLVAAAAVSVPLGAWVAARLPEPQLFVSMGAMVSVAVLLVIFGTRVAALRGLRGALAAGAASGFMNSAAGVGGPALSLYAVNAGWTVREFVPNAQFYGLLVNLFSLLAKGVPRLGRPAWLAVSAALLLGALIGRELAERVPERRARTVVLLLALAGGLTTLAKGLLEL